MTRARNVAKTFSGQEISGNLNLSGIVSATTFYGEGSGLTGVTAVGVGVTVLDSGANRGAASKLDFTDGISVSVISSGIATIAAATTSSVNTADLNVSGMATIGGNISASGIVTASKYSITGLTTIAEGGIDIVGYATANYFDGGTGDFDDFVSNDSADILGTFQVTNQPATLLNGAVIGGITTSTSSIIGSGVTINNGGLDVTGVVTATSYRGDGSQLTGVGTAVVTTSTLAVTGVSTFSDNVNITDILNVEGATELINTRITGVATFQQAIIASGTVNVSGISTFSAESNFSANAKFADSIQARFGTTDEDLRIYHDGSNSYVQDTGTGNLRLISNGSAIELMKDTSETLAKFNVDGSAEIYHDNTKTIETTGVGVTITGICSATGANITGIITADHHVDVGITTYYGDSSYSAAGRWTLTASGTDHYVFSGPGLGHSTQNDPDLYLKRGFTYMFENKMGAHPFRIQSTTNGSTGTQWNVGVTNNDVSNGVLIFEVPFATPDTLYYQCTAHPNMGGVINIS